MQKIFFWFSVPSFLCLMSLPNELLFTVTWRKIKSQYLSGYKATLPTYIRWRGGYSLPYLGSMKTKKLTLNDLLVRIYCHSGRPKVRDITLEISDIFVSYSISQKPIKLSFETKLLWCFHEIDVKCWIQTFQRFVRVVSLTLGLPP